MNAYRKLRGRQKAFVAVPVLMAILLTSCQSASVPSSSVMTETTEAVKQTERETICKLWGGPVPLPAYVWNALQKDTRDALEAQAENYLRECPHG